MEAVNVSKSSALLDPPQKDTEPPSESARFSHHSIPGKRGRRSAMGRFWTPGCEGAALLDRGERLFFTRRLTEVTGEDGAAKSPTAGV